MSKSLDREKKKLEDLKRLANYLKRAIKEIELEGDFELKDIQMKKLECSPFRVMRITGVININGVKQLMGYDKPLDD